MLHQLALKIIDTEEAICTVGLSLDLCSQFQIKHMGGLCATGTCHKNLIVTCRRCYYLLSLLYVHAVYVLLAFAGSDTIKHEVQWQLNHEIPFLRTFESSLFLLYCTVK